KLHSAPVGTFQYEARIEGLSPDSIHYYAVFDGDRRLTPQSEDHRFRAQPKPGTVRPYRFWVLGDSGTGREAQRAVHEGMRRWVQRDGRPLDFWIHVGDMAYGTGRDVEFQSRFFESYADTLRNLVCWPAMGNHEGHTSKGSTGIGPYYDAYLVPTRGESGGLASGTEAYYSFDHGNIHFICLDSHDLDRKPTGAMAKWLKADLEKARAEWLIAFWHHPPYTKGSHDSDKEADLIEVRHHLLPILESGGVDLVLTGHSHIYERSMLMDGAYSTNATVAETFLLDDGDGDPSGDGAYRKGAGLRPHEGTVQVVAGHSGASLGRVGTSPVMRRTIVEHGSCVIDVEGDTLVGRMINREGVERDRFSLVKRGQVTVRRLSLPWQPPEYKAPDKSPKVPNPPPLDYTVLIPAGAPWQTLPSGHPQGSAWTSAGFDASGWEEARPPFRSGRGRFQSQAGTAAGGRPSIYARREFTVPQADKVTELGLQVDHADAMIVYVNGQEVARVNAGRSSGRNVQGLKVREDSGYVYLTLGSAHRYLVDGTNILAIECHAHADGVIDFGLDPRLWMED
ncbi:MAG: metallophosphoesterase, partial [Verrucomicrobiota bacterium]